MKLSRLEVRNAQLTSEITEKSQQTQQLANKISVSKIHRAYRWYQISLSQGLTCSYLMMGMYDENTLRVI